MHCRVEGTGHFVNTSAGSWNSFDILAVDEAIRDPPEPSHTEQGTHFFFARPQVGIPCIEGGDNFHVTMNGPKPGEVVVVDNEDGTYTVKCCATKVTNCVAAMRGPVLIDFVCAGWRVQRLHFSRGIC